jgi:hypothetical protein
MKSFFFIAVFSLSILATLVAFQAPPKRTWNILKKVKVKSTYDTVSNDYKFNHKYTNPIQRHHQKSVTLTGYLNSSSPNRAWLTQHPDCFICVSPPAATCIIVLNNLEQPLSPQNNQQVTITGILNLQPHKVYPYSMSDPQITFVDK